MERFRLLALSGLICLAGGAAANAQTADAAKPSMTPRAGPGYTNGWSLMTPEERHAYQVKIEAMPSIYACRAFVEQHHREMVERAKENDAGLPPPPRMDVCDGLPE